MIVLAIDSTAVCATAAACIFENDKLVTYALTTSKNGLTHSETLLPIADGVMRLLGKRMDEVGLFAVSAGPGSFTGVRIGVSTVKALAHAANKPCVAVDALEALAANVTAFDGVVCPILDARAQQVYGAIFKRGERLTEDTVGKLTLFLDRVEATGENALFLGDGAPGFEAAIRERLGDKAHFAQPQHNGLRAGSACALAARRLEAGETPLDYITLLPLYLRAPQAERERAAREGAKHG